MDLKQQEPFVNFTSNLNEIHQVKPHSEVLTEFSDDPIHKSLSEHNASHDVFRSHILTGRMGAESAKLCEFTTKERFKLLYRGSHDGFSSKRFSF